MIKNVRNLFMPSMSLLKNKMFWFLLIVLCVVLLFPVVEPFVTSAASSSSSDNDDLASYLQCMPDKLKQSKDLALTKIALDIVIVKSDRVLLTEIMNRANERLSKDIIPAAQSDSTLLSEDTLANLKEETQEEVKNKITMLKPQFFENPYMKYLIADCTQSMVTSESNQ
jgi:hypothetical protein